MKKTVAILAALAFLAPALSLKAQPARPGRPARPDGPAGEGPGPGHRPPPPLFAALDIDHDGILSKEEIANASSALLKLDKNGDGQLTEDEMRPPRRGPGGPGREDLANGDNNQPPQDGPRPPRGPENRRPRPEAQSDDANRPEAGRPPGPGGPDGDRAEGHRPPHPLLQALDTNKDGVLSADEIKGASAALLKLDKNGDGQITMDEVRPPRPEGGPRPERRDRAPRE